MADADDPHETGFMGIAYTAISEVPPVEELPPEVVDGILVTDVLDDTPAQRAGIISGDIIFAIENFVFDQSEGEAEEVFQSVLDHCQPGDSIRLALMRQQVDKQLQVNDQEYDPEQYLADPDRFINLLPDQAEMTLQVNKQWVKKELVVVLGRRDDGLLPAPPPLSDTDLDGLFDRPEWESWVDTLVDNHEIREEFDDLYTDGAGVANSFDRPAAWIIDLKGNDAYQSTAAYGAQGSGVPGFGLVYDKSGDDTYIGQRLSQGTGYMGIGFLYDQAGDDRYYGSEFVQGLGLFGMGLLFDAGGDDKYYGTKHAQGAGFTSGLGVLYDAGGDDHGFATGKYPTNYGDPGIFDAWSQGVGMGFRNNASGGIGMVVSGGGDNAWEGGSDVFHFDRGPARAGDNDYHGGHSFSLFVARGEGENHYSSDEVEPNTRLWWPDFGFFLDGDAAPGE